MLKDFELVHLGGRTKTRCIINANEVLWVMPPREDQIGNTIVGVRDNGVVALSESMDKVISTLGVNLVKLRTHDQHRRKELISDVYVAPAAVSLAIRSIVGPFDTIKFVDGTTLDVADAQPLLVV